tara:strand:- start:32179 stop:33039 length:861 start_codon:yes stop_codon:yes gene_type:complete
VSAELTYRGLLQRGASQLDEAGIDGAREDAKFLLFEAAGISSSDFIMREQDVVDDTLAALFDKMIERRKNREPVSLIIGHVDFMGLSFLTDERALAPRSDSERLVEAAMSLTEGVEQGSGVDLGTGTGCLLQSFLHYRPRWTGTAVDLSPDALSLARENAVRVGVQERVTLLKGSWEVGREAISQADVVMSNPPYIVSDVMKTLDPEVLNHDPHLALDGGEDGLDAYRAITSLCDDSLKVGAWLAFEIGYDQGMAVEKLLGGHGFAELTILKDFSGHDRVVLGRKQ